VGDELHQRTLALELRERGHGFDAFGANREWVEGALAATRPLYEGWFRVRSCGAHHIPSDGPAILACNHSGTLPFDGAMLAHDVLRHSDPPRLPRPVGDVFIPQLPMVGTLFSRVGVVAGSRRNFQHLLESGELLMVFPEGTPGIGKNFSQRYQLQRWRHGHAELALRYKAPVVPVAIIGAEEQMPQVARIESVRLFGAPYLPVTLTPLPLPVRYHIHYGQPLALHERYGDPDDPDALAQAAQEVKEAVQALIARGLAQRQGVFT
jgi:1-acyl-sn-glycerol-3-phosphate acyltransferase